MSSNHPERQVRNALIVGAAIMVAWFVFDLVIRLWLAS